MKKDLHKLLKRQIEKHLPTADYFEDSRLAAFISAVNDSYHSFELDKKITEHASEVLNEEYQELNEQLVAEKDIREQSIRKLLGSIAQFQKSPDSNRLSSSDDLLKIANYLQEQISLREVAVKELEQANKTARKASYAKSEFLSVMSHEIRSPLNIIIGMIHIMQSEISLPEQKENLRIIESTSNNLLHLVNDILDFSKIESGKLELEHSRVDLRNLLDDIVHAHSNHAKERGNTIKLRIDPSIAPALKTDRTRLGQVITNLVNNAIKFTEKGTITITVDCINDFKDEQEVKFTVTDTGIGISEQKKKLIFDAFSQATKATTRMYGGSGLGLAICTRLVNLMGGKLRLKSTEEQGSEFYFTVNFEKDILSSSVESKSGKKDLNKARILVVDDMKFNLMVVDKIISNWNVETKCVNNGFDAIELVKNGRYDLVLMDIHMPRMGGMETTINIRKFNKDIKIVALTASSNTDTKKEVLESGMDDFICKPFLPEDLYQKLKMHLVEKIN